MRPLEALFNDNLWHELVHMYLAGFIVAGLLVAAVYATPGCAGGATAITARASWCRWRCRPWRRRRRS